MPRDIKAKQRFEQADTSCHEQIPSNMQYSWLRYIPDVAAQRAVGEDQSQKNAFTLVKKEFGPDR